MTTSHVTEINRMQVRYAIVLEPEAEGGFSVSIPSLPEAHTQGDTLEEAIENAREAALAVVTDRLAYGEAVAPSDTPRR
jgi:antitoxin HicB